MNRAQILDRLQPDPELTRIVVNQSSRLGRRPGMIVLHTTQGTNRPGITDLVGLGNLFDDRSAEVSAHVANDSEGNDAVFVRDEHKAWTCSNDNYFTLNLEQIGFAETTQREWYREHPHQLANTARWIAYWSFKWHIPIRRGVAPAGVLIRSGVASHKQLGILGGGHWDPGPAYPMNYVLWLARFFKLGVIRPGSKEYEMALKQVNKRRGHYGLRLLGA